MQTVKILLIVGGGIAAYKSCELVRTIRKAGGTVTCVLTAGGAQFVTPMTLAALSENPVHTTLWDLKNEAEMGHIQLSREADLVVVCPATADLLAKMAAGIADDLATTLMLATDKPVMAVPAMNVRMWQHVATMRNVAILRDAGVFVMEPEEGAMACGEFGPGRLPDPPVIWAQIAQWFDVDPGPGGVEALEPEDDEPDFEEPEAAKAHGGLGGLLASLIPRSTPRRPVEEVWADEDSAPEPSDERERVEPDPALGGPVLAGKGGARSAPPTDPEAVNHQFGDDAPPEPIAGDDHGISVRGSDPLAGQPEFDADPAHRPLYGRHVLVTAGPTHEPIDPVRYIANRSSGRQGFAIAAAAAAAGARVTLVAGPVALDTPQGVDRIDVESAQDMADAVKAALPADCAVMVAAVADWRVRDPAVRKMKKRGSAPPALMLTENPDILGIVGLGERKPKLLIGFAAETDDLIDNATKKRKAKGADWIVANDVSQVGVMGGNRNQVHIVSADGVEDLPPMAKADVARELVARIADRLAPIGD